jgi:hypothetical protein
MKTYSVKLDVSLQVEAFNIEDATEYVSDIFNLDDEIKNVKIVNIKEI